jgi:hypothetical protein
MNPSAFIPNPSGKRTSFCQSPHNVRNPGVASLPVSQFSYEMGFQPSYLDVVAANFVVAGFMFRWIPYTFLGFYNPAFITAWNAANPGGPIETPGGLLTWPNAPANWPQWNAFVKKNSSVLNSGYLGPNCLISAGAVTNLKSVNYLNGESAGFPTYGNPFGQTTGLAIVDPVEENFLGNQIITAPNFYFNTGGGGQTQWLDPIIPGTYQITFSGAYAYLAGVYSSQGTMSVYAVGPSPAGGQAKILLGSITGPQGVWSANNFAFSSTQYFGQNFWYILVVGTNLGGDLSKLLYCTQTYANFWDPNNIPVVYNSGPLGPADWNAWQTVGPDDDRNPIYTSGIAFRTGITVSNPPFGAGGAPRGSSKQPPSGFPTTPLPGFDGFVNGGRTGP